MKHIELGKLSSRVLAKLIDLLIVVGITAGLFFGVVMNVSFDRTTYVNNQLKLIELYKESNLYAYNSKDTITSMASFSNITTVDNLTNTTVTLDDEELNINLTDALYKFYTEKYETFGGNNLSNEIFKTQVLQIGTETSNINDLVIEDGVYTYVLMDESNSSTTVSYIIKQFNAAVSYVENSKVVLAYSDANKKIMTNTLVTIVPILVCTSFVFDFLIPLFSKNNETIGKYIFKLGVISKDGYRLKKIWILPRWLAYIFIEVILGCLTMFATVLISYTMLMFNKKRRTIHDYLGNSIVINKENSFYFNSPEEERFILENQRSVNL